MPFSTQNLRYGWVALASLGVLGGTIFVVNNLRKQVRAEDIIEIALGTYERCLATQTGTNADGSPVYSVAPTNLIQTWTSNVYTTNGVTIYTNVVTNVVGWHINRAYIITLDSKIKSLVPYYVDTNTVYDGSPNIVMLTVSGLWASLQIGDKTNKFTREPAWTNPVSTNWTVNYTSYWPSTNGITTNIIYTSDYQQVVNYASSWTATGGHVWVAVSNWQSEVVTITNVATYGDYPWQIYVQDLEERYKVLYELKMTTPGAAGYDHSEPSIFEGHSSAIGLNSETGYQAVADGWATNTWQSLTNATIYIHVYNSFIRHNSLAGAAHVYTVYASPVESWVYVEKKRGRANYQVWQTNFGLVVSLYGYADYHRQLYVTPPEYVLSFENIISYTNYVKLEEHNSPFNRVGIFTGNSYYGNSSAIVPNQHPINAADYNWFLLMSQINNWQFNYCTNKYW